MLSSYYVQHILKIVGTWLTFGSVHTCEKFWQIDDAKPDVVCAQIDVGFLLDCQPRHHRLGVVQRGQVVVEGRRDLGVEVGRLESVNTMNLLQYRYCNNLFRSKETRSLT